MKLPQKYFDNLSAAKYREYLKLLPDIHNENTKAFITIALTLVSMSFFGIFAINPTLSTIVKLKKQLNDSEYISQQLSIKINNLSALQQQYNLISPDLPVIFDAIPQTPLAPTLTGQIIALAEQSNLQINSLKINEVQYTGTGRDIPSITPSFAFMMDAQGAYDDMMSFAASLSNFNRIITIESMSLSRDQTTHALILSLRGRQYFKN